MATAIRSTTTQRVRDFLLEQGIAPRPWATLDETYATLYRLLRARADDNAFWKPLSGLLRHVVADLADGPRRLPAPQAELLRSWDVEDLVRDLRRALPGRCAPDGNYLGFARALGAPVLGGFLVLGLAANGCGGDDASSDSDADTDSDTDADSDSDTDSDTDADTDADSGTGPDWAVGCGLSSDSALYALIDANDTLSTDEKGDLCGCMAAMQADWQANLAAVFETCDPSIVASVLEELVAMCETAGGNLGSDPSATASDFCAAPDYKGVAFPS